MTCSELVPDLLRFLFIRTPASPPPLVAETWPTPESGVRCRHRVWRDPVADARVSRMRREGSGCRSRAPKPRERVTPPLVLRCPHRLGNEIARFLYRTRSGEG